MQAFSLSAQFARESTMLKLPKERGKWGKSKGAGRGRPHTYRKVYYFYSPQSSTDIKSKMAATTRTTFRPPKICLHCRLELTLFWYNPSCFIMEIMFSLCKLVFFKHNFHKKRKEVYIKTRSTSASLTLKGWHTI